MVFRNCALFSGCISEINNTHIDNAKDIDVVIPMYNLIEYKDNYSKILRHLWQYYRDKPFLVDNSASTNFLKSIFFLAIGPISTPPPPPSLPILYFEKK